MQGVDGHAFVAQSSGRRGRENGGGDAPHACVTGKVDISARGMKEVFDVGMSEERGGDASL